MTDSPTRSLVKAIMWQLLGLLTMTLVGLVLTGSARLGGTMALINAAVGLTLYVVYERLWQRIGWGQLPRG